MEEIIAIIPAQHLPVVERYLERMLHRIQSRADRQAMTDVWLRQHEEKEHARATAVAAAVKAIRDDGASWDKALKSMGMVPALAEFHLKRGLAAAEAADRAARNHEIARLAAEGVTQAAIARRLKVSPALIRKVLKGEKK